MASRSLSGAGPVGGRGSPAPARSQWFQATEWFQATGFVLTSLWVTAYSVVGLASSLPEAYRVAGWRLTWVGFDLGIALLVSLDGVLLLRRARALPLALGITAGCFICDAWFDCATSGASISAICDLLGELPAAAVCVWVGLRRDRAPTFVTNKR